MPPLLVLIHHPTSFEVTKEKLRELGEVEGVLHVIQLFDNDVTRQELLLYSFCSIIKVKVYNMLTSRKITCVAQKIVIAAPSVIHSGVVVDNTTDVVGKVCLDQAILKFERHNLG